MAFDLKVPGIGDTIAMEFSYAGMWDSASGTGLNEKSAGVLIQVFCETGMIGSFMTGAEDNGDGTWDIFEIRNGARTNLATVPANGSHSYTGTYNLTLITEQWLKMPGYFHGGPGAGISADAEFYERLMADAFPNPAAVNHVGQGSRLYTYYEPPLDEGGGGGGAVYAPSFLVKLRIGAAVSGLGTASGNISIVANGRTMPPSLTEFTQVKTSNAFPWTATKTVGPGGVSVNVTNLTSPQAPNGGVWNGTATLVFCHACPITVEADLYEWAAAWGGANALYDVQDLNRETEAQRLARYQGGFGYDCWDMGIEREWQKNTYASAGSVISRAFVQEFFDANAGGFWAGDNVTQRMPPGTCALWSAGQEGRYIKNSFQPVRFARGVEGPGFVIGPAYDVFSLEHVATRLIDAFDNPMFWTWTVDATYAAPVASLSAGIVRVVTDAIKPALGTRVWPTFNKVHAWRYLDFTIRSVGSADKIAEMRVEGTLPLLPIFDEDLDLGNLVSHRLEWDPVTGADGTWVTRRVDGCGPGRVFQYNRNKYARQVKDATQDPLSFIETVQQAGSNWKKREDLFGLLQFGVNSGGSFPFQGLQLRLAQNTTYELDLLQCVSAGGHHYHFNWPDAPIMAWYDKRVALGLPQIAEVATITLLRDFITNKEPGWTILTLVSPHPIWNMDRPSNWMGGGGWTYSGGWVHQRERSIGGAGPITHRAQAVAPSVRCYPDQPDPVTGGATCTLRTRGQASRLFFGSVYKDGVKVDDTVINVWNLNQGMVTPNAATDTDSDGWYVVKTAAQLDSQGYLVGLNEPYVVEMMSTPANGAPQPRMQVYGAWHHASFWIGAVVTGGGKALEVDSERAWFWTTEDLKVRCYYAIDATLTFESTPYSTYTELTGLSYDRRTGLLFILATHSGTGTHRVLRSADAGQTAEEVLSVTASSSAENVDSERSLVGLWYHDIVNGVRRRLSTDDGTTWEAQVGCTLAGANLDGAVHAVRCDQRTGYYFMTITISSDLRVLRSEDVGLTWTQVVA